MALGRYRGRLAAGGAAVLIIAALGALALSGADPARPGSSDDRSAVAARTTIRRLSVSVSARPVGRPVARGFLGLSIEFQAVRAYTGSDPARINPVLVQLIRNLSPGQAPVLRIGGNSTDDSYAPGAGVTPPPYAAYQLTPSWMASTAALAHAAGARMILGLNLAADRPALASAEVRDYVRAFGLGAIEALEIGNEPNVYGKIVELHTAAGAPYRARPRSFGYSQYRSQFAAIAAQAPAIALAGPALAAGPTAGSGSWVGSVPDLLSREPRLAIMTVHRYPLRNCFVPPSSPQYPTISHLLSAYSTTGLAASLRPWVAIAHAQHRRLRVDELNSVACRGKAGVSDTFASALWITDALFTLAREGVDGVNVHTLPNSAYQLFAFSDQAGRWSARVTPVYYGLQLFAQAALPGSRMLSISRHGSAPGLSVWATRAPDHRVRVVLIDKSSTAAATVTLRPPAGTAGPASVERMAATSISSTRSVTLGGRTYGARTYTGSLGTPRTQTIDPARGGYVVSVAPGSAALVTFAPPR